MNKYDIVNIALMIPFSLLMLAVFLIQTSEHRRFEELELLILLLGNVFLFFSYFLFVIGVANIFLKVNKDAEEEKINKEEST